MDHMPNKTEIYLLRAEIVQLIELDRKKDELVQKLFAKNDSLELQIAEFAIYKKTLESRLQRYESPGASPSSLNNMGKNKI